MAAFLLTTLANLIEAVSTLSSELAGQKAVPSMDEFLAATTQDFGTINSLLMNNVEFTNGNPSSWMRELLDRSTKLVKANPNIAPSLMQQLGATQKYITKFIDAAMNLPPESRPDLTDTTKGKWTAVLLKIKEHIEDPHSDNASTEALLQEVERTLAKLDYTCTNIWTSLVQTPALSAFSAFPQNNSRKRKSQPWDKSDKKQTKVGKCTYCASLGYNRTNHKAAECRKKKANEEKADQPEVTKSVKFCGFCESTGHYEINCAKKPVIAYSTTTHSQNTESNIILDSGCSTSLITATNPIVLTNKTAARTQIKV